MSYILEALKKSQQEREANAAANAPAMVQVSTTNTGSKTGMIIFGLSVCIIVLVLFLLLNVNKSPTHIDQVIRLESVEQVVKKPTVEQPVEEKIITPRTVATVNDAAPQQEQEHKEARAKVEERKLPPLDSLRKIPALMINSHIYSGIPSKRSVTINNKSQREGDYLTSDILIQEITAQGIVIEVDGWPLSISRQQGWQPIPEGN